VPRIRATLLGRAFRFATAPGLFSADRVDDGTRLLLAHLPPGEPRRVLDLGCGWGALALPIAATHPEAAVLAVDRDLLAVEATRANAAAHQLDRIEARGSLGYGDTGDEPFDWILCNVPARIGPRAIAYFLGAGAARLAEGGELRVVVIRDLAPVVEAIGRERGWPLTAVASGQRHAVFALRAPAPYEPERHEEVYARDTVEIAGMRFDRPHDLGEEPAHLAEAVPLLLEIAPRTPPPAILVSPSSYGAIPIGIAKGVTQVTAVERDLLAAAYTRRNAVRLGAPVLVREAARIDDSLDPGVSFDLAVLEVVTSAGAEVARAAVDAALRRAPEALVLGPTRPLREWLGERGARILATRGTWSVARLTRPRR
jgi:methylase of polypeptide subunit release factors